MMKPKEEKPMENDKKPMENDKNSSRKLEKSHRYSARRSSSTSNSKNQNESNMKMTQNNPADKEAINEKRNENGTVETEEKASSNLKETSMSEESQMQIEIEKSEAEDFKATAEEKMKTRMQIRSTNVAASEGRPEESFFKKLDSSMKKNTAFVKKLKNITEQQRESLENEFNGLNLTKYIQEAVSAIVDAKLKVSDVSCAAHIICLFHQRYNEFTQLLKKFLVKNLESLNHKDDEKAANVPKLRSNLRLIAELVFNGVFSDAEEGVQILNNILTTIINCDKAEHIYAPAILTFVRHCGEDLAGILSRKQRIWKEKFKMEFPILDVIPQQTQTMFADLFKEYYQSMAKHLTKDHKSLQNRERQNRQTIGLKGELPMERKEAFEKAQKSYEKLLANTTSLAEMLDEEVPDLPEDQLEEKDETGTTINIFTPVRGNEYDTENGLWEDEDTRTFYEHLKDLKSFVPQILFKEKETKPTKNTNKDQKKKRVLRNDLNLDDDYMDTFSDDEIDDNYEQEILEDDIDETEQNSNSSGMSMAQVVEQFMQNLINCVNRDFIDQAAETFIMKMNRKSNRKKLVRTLFTVSRTRLDLLPFYARLVATLVPCLPDVGQDLVFLLKGDFRFHLRKKHQINLESKVKTVRFIGELTKFKICPKAEALHCLKLLLEDFTHHNIEMACHLLETCGRFLYRSPESHPRMIKLLEQMMRKKTVQTFDSRLSTMIENAYYYCNPPERQKVQEKVLPPMHEYIRKLLYKDLSKTTTEKVLKQMRKLPWDDPEIRDYAVKCLTEIWNVKYNNIHCAANMLAGLTEYHDEIGVFVVDEVLEAIRLDMEINMPKFNQRRVSVVKYLGELFSYQLVEADVIFSLLYTFITFGNNLDGSISALDSADHLLRIRLVCVLLDTCGQYFDRGSSRKKLDCFLLYFQCYIWRKKENDVWNEKCPFPRDVDYMIADTFESLRPKMTIYTTSDEAFKAARELDKEFQEKVENLVSVQSSELPDSLPKDPTQIPLPTSDISGTSLGDSIYSASPSLKSQSTSGEEDGDESDYLSGDDMIEDQNEAQDNGIFMIEADDDVKLKEGPRHVDSLEDNEFCSAFDKMVSESFQGRLNEAMKASSVDIAIPMHLKGKGKKQLAEENSEGVKFVWLIKKGNKQQFRDLDIPVTEDLAVNIRDKQVAEREEHEQMKKLVLDFNQRQEEEAFNEMLASSQQHRHGYHGASGRGHRRGHRLRSRDHDPGFLVPSNRKR